MNDTPFLPLFEAPSEWVEITPEFGTGARVRAGVGVTLIVLAPTRQRAAGGFLWACNRDDGILCAYPEADLRRWFAESFS